MHVPPAGSALAVRGRVSERGGRGVGKVGGGGPGGCCCCCYCWSQNGVRLNESVAGTHHAQAASGFSHLIHTNTAALPLHTAHRSPRPEGNSPATRTRPPPDPRPHSSESTLSLD